jgi:hypothetical protein
LPVISIEADPVMGEVEHYIVAAEERIADQVSLL